VEPLLTRRLLNRPSDLFSSPTVRGLETSPAPYRLLIALRLAQRIPLTLNHCTGDLLA
jgi:hypothetical protein